MASLGHTSPGPWNTPRPNQPGQPLYDVPAIGHGNAAGEVMDGIPSMPGLSEQSWAHDPGAGPPDAPYYAGPLSPVDAMGDNDAGGRDDVASTVQGSVAAATARWQEFESDTFAMGSVYGDALTLPPNPLDPGVGSLGQTDPAGHFYDPPRDY